MAFAAKALTVRRRNGKPHQRLVVLTKGTPDSGQRTLRALQGFDTGSGYFKPSESEQNGSTDVPVPPLPKSRPRVVRAGARRRRRGGGGGGGGGAAEEILWMAGAGRFSGRCALVKVPSILRVHRSLFDCGASMVPPL